MRLAILTRRKSLKQISAIKERETTSVMETITEYQKLLQKRNSFDLLNQSIAEGKCPNLVAQVFKAVHSDDDEAASEVINLLNEMRGGGMDIYTLPFISNIVSDQKNANFCARLQRIIEGGNQ